MHSHFDTIIIGGGPAGVRAALAAAHKHHRVGLIDQTGTIGQLRLVREAAEIFAAEVDRGATYAQAQLAATSFHERQLRLRPTKHALQAAGIATITGRASFVAADTVQVGADRYQAQKLIVATGSRLVWPDIAGNNFLSTCYELMMLPAQPQRVIILGTTVPAIILAQAMAALGSRVWLLPLQQPLAVTHTHINIINAHVASIEKLQRSVRLNLIGASGPSSLGADIIVASGQPVPNLELNLEAAEVIYNEQGIIINSNLRTSNHRIYATGSCAHIGKARRRFARPKR